MLREHIEKPISYAGVVNTSIWRTLIDMFAGHGRARGTTDAAGVRAPANIDLGLSYG